MLVADIDNEDGWRVTADISDAGGRADHFVVDVADERGLAAMPARCVDVFGGIDILVDNAGLQHGQWNNCTTLAAVDWRRNWTSTFSRLYSPRPLVVHRWRQGAASSSTLPRWPPTRAPRMGQMDDVCAMLLFLCSGEAAFITGQTFLVDGGGQPAALRTMRMAATRGATAA